jgi:hypothetical protein
MVRPLKPYRTHRLVVYIREDLYAWALLDLFSELQGRVPLGKWSDTINALLERAKADSARGAT